MLALPKSCRPYKGSKAEQQRQEHFQYQHPRHDASAEFCHEISALEKKRMIKFGENRIKNCFGVGKVITVDKVRRRSLNKYGNLNNQSSVSW